MTHPELRLWRAHGLGNDYLVVDRGPPMSPALVAAICDRHRGVGGDGVLEQTPTDRADHGVRIWNPDGSIAEKSGNGLRIFSRYLVSERGAAAAHTVCTGPDVVRCTVTDTSITVQMGRASTAPADIPTDASGAMIEGAVQVLGQTLRLTALSTGNPHAVTFVDGPLDAVDWRPLGAALERHPLFPNRTNVQFARVLSPDTLEIRIWERGAGPTLASGSSSCAAAAAAVLTGRMPPGRIAVRMPGGTLHVTVDSALDLVLEGPVEPVGWVQVAADWLASRLPR